VQTLVLVLDLVGTFIFALSGAMAAMTNRLDLFGVLSLSFAAGNAGGIIRDLIIGATPPAAIDDWRYLGVSLVAGMFTFWCAPLISRLSSPVQILDAGGLGLFAVSGATKALSFHLDPIPAMLLGMLTGIGGGMLRDMLITEIPSVLRENLYAVAALAGAAVVVAGHALGLPATPMALLGAALCIGLRLISIQRGWQLPRASLPAQSPTDARPDDRSKTP
jgi:uncharacterized membrane protein YeiH